LEEQYGIKKEVEDLTLEDLNPAQVEIFINSIKNSNTASSYLSAFKSLFSFIKKQYIPKSVEDFIYLTQYEKGIEAIKKREIPKYFSKEALNEEELLNLLEEIKKDNDEYLFSAAVVHFYFGARPSELARPFKIIEIDLDKVGMLVKMHGRALIDLKQKLICLPTAKSKHRIRILPFDFIEEHMIEWIKGIDVVLNYCRPNEWFTKKIKTVASRIGLRKVTARTARKTFETMWRIVESRQWLIDYMLGHATTIPDIYTDYRELMPVIREAIKEKHYLLKVLEALS